MWDVFLPTIFVIIITCVLLPFLTNKNTAARSIVSLLMAFFALRYLKWRLFETVLPAGFETITAWWIWFCFSLEVIAWCESFLFFLLMSRTIDRRPQADRYEVILRKAPWDQLPSVDIYIPTYNEGFDVLERTIISAIHIDWPKHKLKVWVLDDGKREWLKEYCQEKEIGYIRRPTNEGAKAGNVNYALSRTKGDLVLFLDADFVVHQKFLYQTVGFFSNPKVAIVQTPQSFFNKDFVQVNLGLHAAIPDDQRLFFDTIMPARDAWKASFFCGSCAIARHNILLEHGSLPHESLTEDILLSMKLLRHGYQTLYLQKKLSHGLAAESIHAFSVQRQRWCRGGIQLLFVPDGPLSKNVPFFARLFFLPLHWIIHPIMRVAILIVPVVFLFTGIPPMLIGNPSEITFYQIPLLLYSYTAMLWFAPWQFIPLLTTAYENITALNLLPTVIQTFIKPFGERFKVTPKGKENVNEGYHKHSLRISMALFFLTMMGIILNTHPQYRIVSEVSFFPIAVAWCFMNLVILGLMILMCFEHPRCRQEERFPINRPGTVRWNQQSQLVTIKDISLTGAHIYGKGLEKVKEKDIVHFFLEDGKEFLAKVVATHKFTLRLKFLEVTKEQRETLIVYIYTGKFINDQPLKSLKELFFRLFHRVFGRWQ